MPGLKDRSIQRLSAAVKKIEREGLQRMPRNQRWKGHSPIVAPVKITSATPTGDYYPGVLQRYIPSSDTYLDEEDCWVKSMNGETYAADDILLCRQSDQHTDGLFVYLNDQLCCTAPTFVSTSGNSPGPLTDNMGMCIQTRGTAVSIATGGFTADRWFVETETDGVDYSAITDPITSACCAARFTKTSNNGQFLVCQFLQHCPYVYYRDRNFVFQAQIKASTSTPIEMGFFQWNGTADAIPATLVSAWGATPTWTAGLASSVFGWTIGTSYAGYAVTSNFSFENLGCVIWTPTNRTVGDWLEITQAFIIPGNLYADPYPRRPELDEDVCAGYFGGTFN